jgi:hypothetical protein
LTNERNHGIIRYKQKGDGNMKYEVTVTNGVVEKVITLKKDGDWVRDVASAERMANAQVNGAWSVVSGKTKELA